jgi:hypothetical protein
MLAQLRWVIGDRRCARAGVDRVRCAADAQARHPQTPLGLPRPSAARAVIQRGAMLVTSSDCHAGIVVRRLN